MKEEKYAVFFPELSPDCASHSGYLWVETLGSGIEGVVDLVRSVTDGRLYARKKTVPTFPVGPDYHSREVFFHRDHPQIPELISSASIQALKDSHVEAKEIKQTVMITKYCNGGTLFDFTNELIESGHTLTESLIWKLLAAQLNTLMYLHSSKPSLARLDNHPANVFLHFPTKSSKLPDFYTGDLGQVEVVDGAMWEQAKPGKRRRLRNLEGVRTVRHYKKHLENLRQDLRRIEENLRFLKNGSLIGRGSIRNYVDTQKWSTTFIESRKLLEDIIDRLWDSGSGFVSIFGEHRPDGDTTWYNNLEELRRTARKQATKTQANDPPGTDFGWARRPTKTPRLWVDRDQLLAECSVKRLPGPFQIAKVDPKTVAVLSIEETLYGTNFPQDTGNSDLCNNFAGDARPRDLLPDPLQDPELVDKDILAQFWHHDRAARLYQYHDDTETLSTDIIETPSFAALSVEDWELLSTVPVLKCEHNVAVADFGESHRNVPVKKTKAGAVVVSLANEDFFVSRWKELDASLNLILRVSPQSAAKSKPEPLKVAKKKKSNSPVWQAQPTKWHQCPKNERWHRVTDDCGS